MVGRMDIFRRCCDPVVLNCCRGDIPSILTLSVSGFAALTGAPVGFPWCTVNCSNLDGTYALARTYPTQCAWFGTFVLPYSCAPPIGGSGSSTVNITASVAEDGFGGRTLRTFFDSAIESWDLPLASFAASVGETACADWTEWITLNRQLYGSCNAAASTALVRAKV